MAGLGFDITADNQQLRDSFKQSEKDALNFEKAMEKVGKSIDLAFDGSSLEEYKRSVQEQKKIVADLEKQYESAKAAFDKINVGTNDSSVIEQRKAASALFRQVRTELDAENETLKKQENGLKLVSAEYDKLSGKTTSYLTQMRLIREEMAQIRGGDGVVAPENIQRYDELKDKLTEVGTAYRLVQKEQQYLTTEGSATLAGVLQGITGLAGGFTAAQGVISLFVKDNEKLAAIQTKLQAAMSITIGLQQVSNALSTTSAFKTQVVTRATQMWAAATGFLNTQLGISVGLSRALVATGIGAILAGIGMAILAIQKWMQNQSELNAKIKETQQIIAENEKKKADIISDSTSRALSSYKRLQKEWLALTNSLKSKQEFITKNKEAFEGLGVEVNNVADAENVLVKNTNAFVNAIQIRARAVAAGEIAAETYKQAMLKQMEAEKRALTPTKQEFAHGKSVYEYKDIDGHKNLPVYMGTEESIKAGKEIQKEAEKLFKQADKLTNDQIDLLHKASDELKNAGIRETKSKDDRNNAKSTTLNDTTKQDSDLRNKYKSLQLKAEQEEINLMKDGSAKRIAQMKLNHTKEIDELRRNKEEYLKLLRDKAKAEFEADPKNKGKKFNASGVGLSKAETDMFDNLEAQTLKRQGSEIAQERIKVLQDYKTYARARLDAIRKYEDERKQLESLGASQEQLSENDRRKDKALEEIDNLFASKQESFNSWMQDISGWTIEHLKNTLAQAKLALSMSQVGLSDENSASKNTEQVAALRAQITALEKQIDATEAKENTGNDKKNNKQAIKQWKLLQDVLEDTRRSFTDLGKAIGGTAGEILSSVGEISASTTQIINHIVTFSQISSTSIEGVSKTAAKAIKSVEKASVILAIIAAALQIAMKIADVIGGDDTTEKYNQAKEAYESYIAILDKVIEKQLKLAESLAGENANAAYEKASETLKSMNDAAKTLGKQYLNSGASKGFLGMGSKPSKGRKEVEDMSDEGWRQAAKVMGMSVSDFKKKMGGRMTGLFELTDEELENLRRDAAVFWGQLDSDTKAYANQIADSVQKILDIEMKEKEDKTLISFDAFRDSFLDTLSDMDSSSADFAENFENYLQKAIINSLIKSKYQKDIENLYNSFAKYNDDDLIDEDEYRKLQEQKDSLVKEMLKDRERMKELYGWESPDDRSAQEKGITSMSQESGDKLIGLWTVSVEHTRQILDRMGLVNVSIGEMQKSYQGLLDTCNSILNHTRNIDRSTASMNTTMQGMNSSISNLRDDINSMKTNGIAIKK